MFQSYPIKESINSERDNQKFCKSYSSSSTKKFKSFTKYFIAYQDDKYHRENNISIGKEANVDPVKSEDNVESENK